MKKVFRGVLFCPLNRGKSGAAGKGEASVASQSAECFAYHMALKVNPVTLTSYSSPCGRYHNPRPERPSNLRTLRPIGPVNPKNLFPQPFSTTLFLNPFPQPAADRRPQPSGRSPVNPHTEGVSKGSFYRIYSLTQTSQVLSTRKAL